MQWERICQPEVLRERNRLITRRPNGDLELVVGCRDRWQGETTVRPTRGRCANALDRDGCLRYTTSGGAIENLTCRGRLHDQGPVDHQRNERIVKEVEFIDHASSSVRTVWYIVPRIRFLR